MNMAVTEKKQVRARIDPARSRFGVKVFATGILSSFAHDPTFSIRNFSGEILFTPDHPEESSLQLNIHADSLELTDDVSAKDRKEIEQTAREQVLETARFPEITFSSTSIHGDRVFRNQY